MNTSDTGYRVVIVRAGYSADWVTDGAVFASWDEAESNAVALGELLPISSRAEVYEVSPMLSRPNRWSPPDGPAIGTAHGQITDAVPFDILALDT
jgi:hypothetical protein